MLSELKSSSAAGLALAGLLVAGMVAMSAYLLPFWRESEELSHGFFTPVLSVWLLWLAREEPAVFGPGARRVWTWLAAAVFLIVAPVAGMAALAQGAGHSQTAFLVALTFAVFVAGAVAALAGARWPLVPLNGASLCAAGLWVFAAPLPSGVLSRLTLLLQDQITGAVLAALRLLGIPAMRHGNVLELSQQLVGVEEACSGIRSLIACLFAGVFLGGYLLRGVWPRLGLVAGAALLAVVANFFRSLFLCLLVARDVNIEGLWHDATAYAVLGVTVVILYVGCSWLASDEPVRSERPAPGPGDNRTALNLQLGLAAVAVLIAGFVAWRTLPGRGEIARPVPDLARLLDLETEGWRHAPNPGILRFADALNTAHLHEETYLSDGLQVTFYMAFWPAGQSSLGSVGLHTPDLCMPGAGWTMLPPPPAMPSYPLADPRRFSFEKNIYPQHVWFWHFYGGYLVEPLPGLYPWQLAPYLIRRPVSSSAPQWVIRVSAN
ncbi:MAG: exosortase/archaeosortase family protein, partial [Verrucomicrobiota bacterium]